MFSQYTPDVTDPTIKIVFSEKDYQTGLSFFGTEGKKIKAVVFAERVPTSGSGESSSDFRSKDIQFTSIKVYE